ncbi:hypothetical protein HWD94_03965 [Pseudarthrobacter equi]|uniref:hypothetical protein n=1 Tax=Pseudarthrobacter equi TaxID=728066 RepID=UPI0021BF2625|nr:hypothetical protein [Pseudarthrobacter equi]MCT9624279.1 hypothetical protein [Pseudarthrobacter equi]
MRLLDVTTALALEGSRPADTWIARAWRGNQLVVDEPLEIIDWSAQDSAGDNTKIAQQLTLTIADPAGRLGAWKYDDPLSVAGTEVQLIYKVGGAGAVNFGWFRVTGNEPEEVVDSRALDEYGYIEPDGDLPPHMRRVYVTPSRVRLTLLDRTINPDLNKLEQPESPRAGATIISEWRRLTGEHFPTVVDDGVVDRAVSTKLVYEKERLEAGQDLLGRISAGYRMGGDGECHIYPLDTDPVLRIEPGNAMVSVGRKQLLSGLYNRWVVEGKDQGDGLPIRAAANLTVGPLAYGGAHGKAPFFYQSEMIGTIADAAAYAEELRDKFLRTLALELSVSMTPHPGLQGGDRVEIGCPIAVGHVVYFTGTITGISRSGDVLPRETSLTVSCSYLDILTGLSRTPWAKHLTDERPELTWDRMPATWGTLPDVTWTELP